MVKKQLNAIVCICFALYLPYVLFALNDPDAYEPARRCWQLGKQFVLIYVASLHLHR